VKLGEMHRKTGEQFARTIPMSIALEPDRDTRLVVRATTPSDMLELPPYDGTITYLISQVGTPFFKVGISKVLQNRFDQLRGANPFNLEICGTIYKNVEDTIHYDLREDRVNGEWFVISRRTKRILEGHFDGLTVAKLISRSLPGVKGTQRGWEKYDDYWRDAAGVVAHIRQTLDPDKYDPYEMDDLRREKADHLVSWCLAVAYRLMTSLLDEGELNAKVVNFVMAELKLGLEIFERNPAQEPREPRLQALKKVVNEVLGAGAKYFDDRYDPKAQITTMRRFRSYALRAQGVVIPEEMTLVAATPVEIGDTSPADRLKRISCDKNVLVDKVFIQGSLFTTPEFVDQMAERGVFGPVLKLGNLRRYRLKDVLAGLEKIANGEVT
jgi:hypothetical protein